MTNYECLKTDCVYEYPSVTCVNCGLRYLNYQQKKPITNADKIRNMTNGELAEMIDKVGCGFCETYMSEMPCKGWTSDDDLPIVACIPFIVAWLNEEAK